MADAFVQSLNALSKTEGRQEAYVSLTNARAAITRDGRYSHKLALLKSK